MESGRELDAACCARALFALILALVLHCAAVQQARAQCSSAQEPPEAQIQQLFQQQNWAEVVRAAGALPSRSADVQFTYGMALAHLGRLADARAALLAGARVCREDKRFPIELAGLAFEQQHNSEAAHWLRRGLRLDPADAYANNFLGTVYFLSGNLPAALRYWNRVQKPQIAALDLDSRLRVHRLLLDRAFAFSPAAVLQESQLTATETRLRGLGIFPAYNLHLDARKDGTFDAVFRAQEQNGFGGSKTAVLVSTLAGVPYQTIYPSYRNIGRGALNFDALIRWDAQKRRAWGELSGPLSGRPEWRWKLATDLRNENWALRRSFTGPAPVLGSFNLEREAVQGSLTSLQNGAVQWTLGAEVSHRIFRETTPGPALTPALVTPGYELKPMASIEARLMDRPQDRFTLKAGAASGLARTFASSGRLSEKLQGSAVADWLPGMEGDRYEFREQVRAGKIFGTAPFDNLFVLGMDRDDTDLWMRGHVATRDGRKGSSPVGDAYLLSNTDMLRRVCGNGLLEIHVGPLLDVGKMTAPVSGLSTGDWRVDTGIEARLRVLHTSVVLSWGRDLRSGANAFWGNAEP